MKKSVIIAVHPKSKEMLTVNANNKDWSTMRVEQKSFSLENLKGVQSRSAFITKKNSDWDILKKKLNLSPGMPISGQIIRTETRYPQYEGHQPKKYPEGNPKAGEVFLVDGQPVYFTDEFTEDMNRKDELISVQALATQSVQSEQKYTF